MIAVPLAPRYADATVILSEKFLSFQGEGPWMGQRCAFVRFSRCNLRCGWCDTKYTWDWTQYRPAEVSERVPVRDLPGWVREQEVDLLVITGGEPMLQQKAMIALASTIPDQVRVQVETNGTQVPEAALVDLVDLWVVSPKLANSGMDYAARIAPTALTAFRATGRATFKFVVTDVEVDFEEIDGLVAEFGLEPVWVMPEGETAEQVLAGIAALYAPAVAQGWNVSPRLQTLTGAR